MVDHGLALCDEFTHRYGGQHKSRQILLEVAHRGPAAGELEPFAQAMPDEYKQADPVLAYRAFLVGEKSRYATWKDATHRPDWWPIINLVSASGR